MHCQIYATEQSVQGEENNTLQYLMNNGPGLSLVFHLFPFLIVVHCDDNGTLCS